MTVKYVTSLHHLHTGYTFKNLRSKQRN